MNSKINTAVKPPYANGRLEDTHHLTKFSLVENVLIFPIGLTLEQAKDNAKELNVSFLDELHRVIIHGALHLIGFDDKSEAAQVLMTQKENEYLAKRTF